MAITLAVRKGNNIYVYDGNKQLCIIPMFSSNDDLVGFTSSSVSVRKGQFIYTYDEKGRQISTTPI